jgi:hypothetical protein
MKRTAKLLKHAAATALLAAAAMTASVDADAQDYPSQDIRIL